MATEMVPYVVDVPSLFQEQKDMAVAIADSDLLPGHLRKKPANVLVILAGARALGVSWFQAMQSFFVVEGKLSMSAEMMRALVIRNGHKFRIIEMTNEVARVQLIRKDDPDFEFVTEFTVQDAKDAELLGKTNWKRYRSAMLLARATSKAIRSYIPDVLAGNVYTPEELGARVDEDGKPLFNPDGTAILDVEEDKTESGEEIQEKVDKFASDVAGGTFDSAAASYKICTDRKWTHLIPNLPEVDNDLKVYDLWLRRLVSEIDNVVTAVKNKEASGEAAKAFLRVVWTYANRSGVINQVFNGETVNDRVAAAVKTIDDLLEVKPPKTSETSKIDSPPCLDDAAETEQTFVRGNDHIDRLAADPLVTGEDVVEGVIVD